MGYQTYPFRVNMNFRIQEEGFILELSSDGGRLGIYVFSNGFAANAYIESTEAHFETFAKKLKDLSFGLRESVRLEDPQDMNAVVFEALAPEHIHIQGSLADEDYYGLRQELEFEAIVHKKRLRLLFEGRSSTTKLD